MLTTLFESPLFFLIWVASLLVAITIHEFSHALIADRLGDPTPRLQGRLTLNPLAHLDPIGTLMLIVASFGWGKPVQFDPYNLENPRRDAALISVAGPISNILLASVFSLLFRLTASPLLVPFIVLNVSLAVFNLVPIHPLDGGKILIGLVSPGLARDIDGFLNRYGMFLLLFLILPLFAGRSLVSILITPIINFLLSIYIPGLTSLI
ncbi:MAG: site-2 protease family protein [Patescibacteria group bacterium]